MEGIDPCEAGARRGSHRSEYNPCTEILPIHAVDLFVFSLIAIWQSPVASLRHTLVK